MKGLVGLNLFVEVKCILGNVFIENGSKFVKGGKYLGKGVVGVGFGIGMYDDFVNDDKIFGEVLLYNGMMFVVGSGVGVVVIVGVLILLGSNLVGWVVIGGFVVGILVLKVVDWVY